jgi:hypothetical protein
MSLFHSNAASTEGHEDLRSRKRASRSDLQILVIGCSKRAAGLQILKHGGLRIVSLTEFM